MESDKKDSDGSILNHTYADPKKRRDKHTPPFQLFQLTKIKIKKVTYIFILLIFKHKLHHPSPITLESNISKALYISILSMSHRYYLHVFTS